MIEFKDFENVDMRVGKIISVEDFPEARVPSYKLTIDFGPLGIKKSSAHATHYSKEQLIGKQVICVVNFKPRQVANFMSEVLVLGIKTKEKDVALLMPDSEAILGERVF